MGIEGFGDWGNGGSDNWGMVNLLGGEILEYGGLEDLECGKFRDFGLGEL